MFTSTVNQQPGQPVHKRVRLPTDFTRLKYIHRSVQDLPVSIQCRDKSPKGDKPSRANINGTKDHMSPDISARHSKLSSPTSNNAEKHHHQSDCTSPSIPKLFTPASVPSVHSPEGKKSSSNKVLLTYIARLQPPSIYKEN